MQMPSPELRMIQPVSSCGYGVTRTWRATNSLGCRLSRCRRSSFLTNAPAAESIARIHPGSHEAPCSMTPIISRGKRSRTPSKIIVARVCIGDSPMAMYDTEVKLPSPPWKSLTSGSPLRLYTGSIGRPPPTWNTIGISASSAIAHSGSKPMCVGPCSRGQTDGIISAAAPASSASRADLDRRVDRPERHPAHRQQPAVDAAEVDDAAVVRPGGAERQVLRAVAVEHRQRVEERAVEDQLALEAEAVERSHPVASVERAERVEVLVDDHVERPGGDPLGAAVRVEDPADLVVEHPATRAVVQLGQAVAHVRVGVLLVEPVGLDHVRVGVVDDPPGGVRLAAAPARPCRRWSSRTPCSCPGTGR